MQLPTKQELNAALTARIGEDLHKRLEHSTVAICGLGGLGSNVAVSLARAGVGRLILIDFDSVDISNLNRQQYRITQIGQPKPEALCENLRDISPYIELTPHFARLCEDNYEQLLSEADIICEAFDKAEEKSRLVNYVLEKMPDKYIVSASGMAGYHSPNTIVTKRLTKRFYLCGDEVSGVETGESLCSARVALCASHQALTILRIISGRFDIDQ